MRSPVVVFLKLSPKFIFYTEENVVKTNTCPLMGACELEKVLHRARAAFMAILAKLTMEQIIQRKGNDPRLGKLKIVDKKST